MPVDNNGISILPSVFISKALHLLASSLPTPTSNIVSVHPILYHPLTCDALTFAIVPQPSACEKSEIAQTLVPKAKDPLPKDLILSLSYE